MSDLISRSELLKAMDTWDKFGYDEHNRLIRIDSTNEEYVPYVRYEDMVNCVMNIPTAYDVDKVVEELKVIKKDALTEYNIGEYNLDNNIGNSIAENYRKDMNEGRCFAYDEAIEIVKQGGVGNESD